MAGIIKIMNAHYPQRTARPSCIPFNEDYVQELGAAMYIFSYLEWGVVCCNVCLEPGYEHIVDKGTAHNIAEKFQSLVRRSTSIPLNVKPAIEDCANKFLALVADRNMLVHGNPYTAISGSQQLLYSGKSGRKEWAVDEIRAVAAKFEELAIEVNKVFHNHLAMRIQ